MEDILNRIAGRSKQMIPAENGDYINQDDNGLLYCGKCHTRKQGMVHMPFGELRPHILCKCQQIKADRERAEQQAREFAEAVQRNKTLCYPKAEQEKMLRKNFDNAEDSKLMRIARNYVENFPRLLKEGKGLTLFGGTGAGKSYAAACICNALLGKGYRCMFTNFARIRNELSGMWEERQDYIDGLSQYSLLVLDDLGAESDSSFMSEIVHAIIDARLRAGLPTIVTTNLTALQLSSGQDISRSRIYSRLFEMTIPIEVKHSDRRRDNMAEESKKYASLLGM